MITEAILYFITVIIKGVVSVLPEASMPDWLNSSINSITQYVIQWNFIFPMTNLVYLILFFLSIETAVLTIYGVNAIIKLVRGSG